MQIFMNLDGCRLNLRIILAYIQMKMNCCFIPFIITFSIDLLCFMSLSNECQWVWLIILIESYTSLFHYITLLFINIRPNINFSCHFCNTTSYYTWNPYVHLHCLYNFFVYHAFLSNSSFWLCNIILFIFFNQ